MHFLNDVSMVLLEFPKYMTHRDKFAAHRCNKQTTTIGLCMMKQYFTFLCLNVSNTETGKQHA